MNHPKPEEWAPYLFGETKLEERRQLQAHLKECQDCRHEFENWQRSLGRLDAWKLMPAPRPRLALTPVLSWAATAALILLVGFAVGRFTGAQVEVAKVRAAIEPELRRELSHELAQFVVEQVNKSAVAALDASGQQTDQAVAELGKAIEQKRSEEQRRLYEALNKVESQSFAQFLSLKRDLDTVALNTDAELRDTAQGLVQLAGYARPGGK